jgi:transposase
MRGDDVFQDELFSYGGLGERVPAKHPLRRIREFADVALGQMSAELEGLYSKIGRPSIAPEQLLRALLLQMLYSVRSERMLVEQLEYNLLFRWFVGLPLGEHAWSATSFSKNRERRSRARWRRPSSPRWWPRRGGIVCSTTSTSPWTAR